MRLRGRSRGDSGSYSSEPTCRSRDGPGDSSGPERAGAVLLARYGAVYIEMPKAPSSSIEIVLSAAPSVEIGVAEGDPHKVSRPAQPSGGE